MNNFVEKNINELNINPFEMVGKQWMLITAGDKNSCNTMTASWGGMGVMWYKNVVNIVIRPQRYTKTFVDSQNTFSLSFFNEDYRKTLQYCGKVSGREEKRKIENTELTLCYDDESETPFFHEASMVIICKKLFRTPFKEEDFIDKQILDKAYPDKDYHFLYFGEILKALVKK